MKKCTKCFIEKPLLDFHKDSNAKGGRHPVCKNCKNKYTRSLNSREKTFLETKICTKCKVVKDVKFFSKNCRTPSGLGSHCKQCSHEYDLARKIQKDHAIFMKTCSSCLETKLSNEFSKSARSSDGYRSACKTCDKKVREKTKDYRSNYARKKIAFKRKNDPFFLIKDRARGLIYDSLRRYGYKKGSRTEKIIGISFLEFKSYIESKFLEGMCWEKRGEWHIDHIVPLSTAKNEDDVIKLCHYTNLQPLWAKDNLKKGSKIIVDLLE